jgi:hypothetical protein
MIGTNRRPWILERTWDDAAQLPRRWVLPGDSPTPFDFSGHMHRLCDDIALQCPDFAHIDTRSMLFTYTPARNRNGFGLQARVTPMRFRGGERLRRVGDVHYQAQRYTVGGREMLYLVTFCLPRFLDQSFTEKLVTVFHELYHIGPAFDGDLRRHEGRYAVHTRSKKDYDVRMAAMARQYVTDHPEPDVFDFLRRSSKELVRERGGVTAIAVPRPKMIPVCQGRYEY